MNLWAWTSVVAVSEVNMRIREAASSCLFLHSIPSLMALRTPCLLRTDFHCCGSRALCFLSALGLVEGYAVLFSIWYTGV